MEFEGILNQALNADTISQMSQTLGTDESTTGNAVQAALPLLLGAMAQNSSSAEGNSSLLSALDPQARFVTMSGVVIWRKVSETSVCR